jgi:nicotinate dehydrogenase subunit B
MRIVNGRRERCQSFVRLAVEAVKFETFVKITADGSVTAYNGHVDLGTGIRTTPGRLSRKNSTCPLRVSSSCWAIRRSCPIRARPSPANDPDHRRAAAQAAAQARRFLAARARAAGLPVKRSLERLDPRA